MIKLIVFDFDGTLADTKALLLKLIKEKLGTFNYALSKTFIKEFGDRPLEEALDVLGVHERVLATLVENIEMSFVEHAKHVKAVPHVQSLTSIKKKKIILSNSLTSFIKLVLKKEHASFFHEIYGAESGKDKYTEFKEILRKYHVQPKQVIYLGDRPIDVKLARRVGCTSVIVSNSSSWSSRRDILAAKPDFMIAHLGQLQTLIHKLDHIAAD